MHLKWKTSAILGRKHHEKRRNCLQQAISPFTIVFHSYTSIVHQNGSLCGNGLNHHVFHLSKDKLQLLSHIYFAHYSCFQFGSWMCLKFCHLGKSYSLDCMTDWLIVWSLTAFSTVFQLYHGQCTYQCFPGVLLTSTLHNILSKPLAAFPHNHCRKNRQQWEGNESCRNDYHQSSEITLARVFPKLSVEGGHNDPLHMN